MFDELLRELKRLKRGAQVSVSIPADADGYYEKECPNPECLSRFRIHREDWDSIPDGGDVHCPVCGHVADEQSWFTSEQLEYARGVARAELEGRIDRALRRDAAHFNRTTPRNGLITMSLDYKPGRRSYVAPLAVSGVLEQRSACEACGARYASVGAAFFCPVCGHNSARSTFAGTLATIRAGLDLIPRLTEMLDRDQAADLGRGIAETSLGRLVTAFQRYAEATYDALPDPKPVPSFNAFQRLADGSALFVAAGRAGYDAILDAGELAELGRYFQQRHCLVHDDGIVDQLYLDRSGDTMYRLGQRLVIKPSVVRRAADLLEKLAAGL